MSASDATRDQPARPTRPVRPPRRWWVWVSAGCGGLAVILMVGGALVGGALYVGGAFGPRWRSFDVPDGGCRVDLPAAPSRQSGTDRSGPKNFTAYAAYRRIPVQEFGVGYFDAHAEPQRADLDATLTELLRATPETTERTRGPATAGGYPGRQVVADGPTGTIVARVVSAGNRVYVLVVIGRGIGPDTAEVGHFFDSFQITDDVLLARAAQEAERQAAGARRAAENKARSDAERQEQLNRAEAARKEYERFEASGGLGRELPDGATLPGVKMYFPFEPTAGGAELRDAVGGRVYAAAVKAPTRFGIGARGSGVHMPGEYTAVYLPDTAGVQFGPEEPFTIAGWFRARQPNGDVLRIGPSQDTFGTPDYLVVELQPGAMVATLWAPQVDPKGAYPQATGAMSAAWSGDDGWHHFAVVRTPKPGGEMVELYFDGVRTSQQFRNSRTDLYAAKMLALGGERPGRSHSKFRGGIDEVYTFSRALTETDVRRLAGLTAAAAPAGAQALSPADLPGLVFHLPFDDTDGQQVTEAVTKKLIGRVNGTIEIVDGVRGRAARLAPGGSRPGHVALALTSEKAKIEFAQGTPFTIATWFRSREIACVLSNSVFDLAAFEGSVSVGVRVPAPGGKGIADIARLTGPRPKGWLHVAFTRADDGELTLYVNGEPSRLDAKRPKLRDALPLDDFGLVWSSRLNEPCDLDEFCIYDRALTADEVKKLGARPGTPKEKGPK